MSVVPRETDQIIISQAFQDLWKEEMKKTKYLGEHSIFISQNPAATTPLLESTETYHVFYNTNSFHRLEENFSASGGAFGVKTLYVWREKFLDNQDKDGIYCDPVKDDFEECQMNMPVVSEWVLRGIVTLKPYGGTNGQPMGYTGDLGDSFRAVESQNLLSSDYEMIFFQKECMEYLDDYMLVKSQNDSQDDQVHLVKRVGNQKN